MRFKAPSYHTSAMVGLNGKERNKVSAGRLNSIALTWLAKKKKINGSVSIRKSQLDFLMRLRRALKELHIIV